MTIDVHQIDSQSFVMRAMIPPTIGFPTLGGKESHAKRPCRAHPSSINVPHKRVHAIVHAQPQTPCTFVPVVRCHKSSSAAPTPMRTKNAPALLNSAPLPSPHMPIWCNTADTPNAPSTAPGRPRSAPPGRAPNTTKMCRRHWCQRKLQKSAIEVAVQGRAESAGQSAAGCRRSTRPTSVAVWYITSIVVYAVKAQQSDKNAASAARGRGSRCGSKKVSPAMASSDGRMCRTMQMATSYTVSLRSNLKTTTASEGGGGSVRKNDSGPHDHLIPRWLNMRSKESRMIFWMVGGRSTGVCWPSAKGSYLLNGFLVSAHSIDRNAMTTTPIYSGEGNGYSERTRTGINIQTTASAPHIQGSNG
jgi:hypothetical protein